MNKIRVASILLCLLFTYTCYNLYADNDTADEIRLGRSIAAIVAGSDGVLGDPTVNRYINLVGSTIAFYNGRPEIDYYFSVLNTDAINAIACPGGYIFVTRGLLYSLHNEAELAGVLAHEIAHVNYKHVYNKVLQKRSKTVDSAISKIIGGRNVSLSVAFNQVVNKSLEILLRTGLPHQDEYEADAAALIYLDNGAYRQLSYIDVLDRIRTMKNDGKQDDFSDTHPSMTERIARLRNMLPSENRSEGLILNERFEKNIEKKI